MEDVGILVGLIFAAWYFTKDPVALEVRVCEPYYFCSSTYFILYVECESAAPKDVTNLDGFEVITVEGIQQFLERIMRTVLKRPFVRSVRMVIKDEKTGSTKKEISMKRNFPTATSFSVRG